LVVGGGGGGGGGGSDVKVGCTILENFSLLNRAGVCTYP